MFKRAILLVIFFYIRHSESVDYDGHQLWRVVPKTREKVLLLREIGEKFQLDFWKDPVNIGRPVDFRVSPTESLELRKTLESSGIMDVVVSVTNIQTLIDKERTSREDVTRGKSATAKTIATFDYSVYHPVDEVYEWISMVESEYPDIVTKQQVGVTFQGRPLYVLEFKKNSDAKPAIYVDSLIHCREWISTASLLFVFKEMLQNEDFSHMLDDVNWYFIPFINVDGYVETWNGDRLWRKTKSTGPSSLCSGTDGNRNWDSHWSEDGASPFPCSYTYHGPTPFSESEIRHLSHYILGKKDIEAVVSTHSYSQLILYPWNWVSGQPSPDDEVLALTGKGMSDAMRTKHGSEYVYGPGGTLLYVSSGVTADWTYEKANVTFSYIFELRDQGQYGFLLPDDQIIPTGEEFILGLQWLANYVADNYAGSGDRSN